MARSDTGLAERFTYYHGADVVFQAESGQWFMWNGQRWQRDAGQVEIRRRFAETARRIKDEVIRLPKYMPESMRIDFFRFALSCEQIGRMDAAARLAPSLGLARPLAMFDADPMLLACSNGVVDLRTGGLRPHRREDFITKISSVEFHPDTARDPGFRVFIEHATGGDAELETYLQRAAAYTLTGSIGEKCLFIIYSELTDTSKTCFITGLLTAAGDYGMSISFDALLEPDRGGQPNYDIAKLCGTRLAVASETKPGRRFAAELIKQLTGGDTLRAREIRQSSIEFRPTHKLWLCTNHAPTLADGGDEATWNRLRRVPFNNQVPREKRDPRFLAALSDPGSAISRAFLDWAVKGAVAWQKSGLGGCQAVDESTAAYQTETDPLIDFLEDSCQINKSATTTAADLRQAYEAWANDNGQRFTLSRQRFAAVLRKHGCQEHRGTGGIRSWIGISLKGVKKTIKKPKIHYSRFTCHPGNATTDPAQVTCARCKRRLERLATVPKPISWRDGIPEFAVTAEGRWTYPRRPDGTRPPDGCHLTFQCPRCGSVNRHGGRYGHPGAGDGHRASHCQCWDRGYFIQETQ